MSEEKSEQGAIKIHHEVVGIIAGLATMEIPGVAGMSSGIAGGIAEKLGIKNLDKGVKVDMREGTANIDLSIIVDYGVNIAEIAGRIQENVRKTVERMMGLSVEKVNVNVQGVQFASKRKGGKRNEGF